MLVIVMMITIMPSIKVRGTLISARSMKDPMILTSDIKIFSGPWCASSEISNKSDTRMLIILPVL